LIGQSGNCLTRFLQSALGSVDRDPALVTGVLGLHLLDGSFKLLDRLVEATRVLSRGRIGRLLK
jgi:hypothetical protein